MKKLAVLFACVLALSSCVYTFNGNKGKSVTCKGPVVTRTFEFADFEAVTINGGADIDLFQGDFKVSVKANEEVYDYLDYEVIDGVLVIKTKDNLGIRSEEYDITVSLPFLTALTVNGAGEVEIVNGYTSDKDMDITINGAADIDITGITVPSLDVVVNGAGDIDVNDMNVETLSVIISGAGDVDLSGKAGSATLSVSGAGDIDARGLECTDVKTSKSGLASIRLK